MVFWGGRGVQIFTKNVLSPAPHQNEFLITLPVPISMAVTVRHIRLRIENDSSKLEKFKKKKKNHLKNSIHIAKTS